ncbi:MAG: molybdenum cofactor guanylyltransferase [Gammaproteobacteria bacterium]|nr:molybdenum cofactor guanylyltransferase [Gammaproteobacteria bacterium]
MNNNNNSENTAAIHCVILAGGKARRFDGRDKGLIEANNSRLIDHVLNIIKPQVSSIMISANRNLEKYKQLGYPVLTDNNDAYDGPLAGILAALEHINDGLLAVIPCDMPDIPKDIISQLQQQMLSEKADICCVSDNNNLQPLLSIMNKQVQKALKEFLQADKHKVQDWFNQQNMTTLNLDNNNPLFNINNMKDLKKFETRNHE